MNDPFPAAAGRFDSFIELIRERSSHGARPAFTFLPDGEAEGPHLTYEELDRRARAIGAHLQQQGAAGQRALLLYNPGLEFISAFAGCLFAGVVGIPVAPARRPRDLARLSAIAADSKATLALTSSRGMARSRELCAGDPVLARLKWQATDDVPSSLAAEWSNPGIDSRSLAFLQYTSGSTGAPRGVMVSHGNLLHNSSCIQRIFGFTSESLGLTWLPHFHDMGLIGGLLQPIYAGCASVVMPPAAFLQRPYRWLRAVTRYRVSTIVAPNFAYELCTHKISAEERASLRLDSVKVALTGAEPVRYETLQRFAETFRSCGFRSEAFRPAYGLAEATLIVSGPARGSTASVCRVDAAALERHLVRASSGEGQGTRVLVGCGGIVPDTEVAIVDPETKRACSADQVGEIWVSGPGVAQGYWAKAEETERTFQARIAGGGGTFLRTGDMGFLQDGSLVIAGRLKDLIIVRGSNHYSQDLEQTVEASHRALRAGCGAAFSAEIGGEERLVIVQEIEKGSAAASEEIVEAIRRALVESHEVQPYAIVLIEPHSISKTSSGKIQRFACRDAYLSGKLAVIYQWRQEDSSEESSGATERSGLVWDYLGGRPAARSRVSGAAAVSQTAAATEPRRMQADRSDPIAVIGFGCRFPGADNLEALWRLVRDGKDAIREVPAERWDVDSLYDPIPGTPGKMSTRWGGFLEGVDLFDPHFFGISPREASVMDPQQRLLLEVAWEALETAGQAPEKLAGSKTGVFVGIGGFDYSHLMLNYEQHIERLNAYAGTGLAHSIAANRLSYLLDLRGPSVSLDTACSSSLVALHLACQSLRNGQSDLALAGGVNLILSPETTIAFSHARMMASDGRCKTFDAKADGYVRSEGCGIVVLKRLSEALRDRDNILAVLRGSAVNQDGRTAGISAPNGLAQRAVIREALAQAGVEAGELSYVEIHGTGTSIGDPIEVEAVKAVLGESRPGDVPCLMGSVKANIGHLENASGVAGLAKVILCLQRGQIPGQIHLKELNPRISLDDTRLTIPRTLQSWPAARRRIAGLNSFGFGGTNAHVTIEEPPSVPRRAGLPQRPLHLFTLSARTSAALKQLTLRYIAHLTEHPEGEIADICFTANAGRSHFSHRLAVVAKDAAQLQKRLSDFAEGRQAPGFESGHAVKKNGLRIAFLFAGLSAFEAGRTRPLFQAQPVFRKAIEECAKLFAPHLDLPLLSLLYPQPEKTALIEQKLKEAKFAEPALFALQYALMKLWGSWGIQPDAVIGCGAGEFVAAAVSGVLGLEESVRLVAERARLMALLPENRILSEKLLSEFTASAAQAHFQKSGIVFTGGTGQTLAEGWIPDATYWRRQLECQRISKEAFKPLEGTQWDVLLEVWPDATLTDAARQELASEMSVDWISSLKAGADPWLTLLEALGTLYLRGGTIDWSGFDAPYQPRKLFLPTYPFERERYWEDPPAILPEQGMSRDPLLGRRLISALPSYQFESKLSNGNFAFLKDHRIQGSAVLPASAYLDMALSASQEVFGAGFHAVENVMFHQAARVPESGSTTMQLIVSPPSGGSAMFQIFTRSTDREAVWLLHASGEICMRPPEPAASAGTREALDEIKARSIEKGDKAEFYAALRRRGLEYGPAFQGVQWYWRGTQEALAEICVAAPMRIQENYQIYPALLDACVQSLAAAFPKDGPSARPQFTYLPSSVGSFRLLGRPGERLFSHCSLRSGSYLGAEFLEVDIRLLSEEGSLVAEMNGLKVKRFGLETAEPAEAEERGDWLYELTWSPSPASGQPPLESLEPAGAGRWLLFGDGGQLASTVAQLIGARGGMCDIAAGREISQLADGAYRGVIYLPAHRAARIDGGASDVVSAQPVWTELLGLVKGLGRIPADRQPQLVMITRGAQAAGPAHAIAAPALAPLWGFARSADLEYPGLRFTRVDLDPEAAKDDGRAILEEMLLLPLEREVAYREGIRYVPRLIRRVEKSVAGGGITIPDGPSFRLESLRPGSLENLALRAVPRPAPGPGQVEIQVLAAGLNFRDVMSAMGLYPGGPIPLGAECAGKVAAVGKDAGDFRIGDEVIAVVSGSFAACAMADARAVVRKPKGMDWAQAATIPVTFLTAYCALHQLAGLSAGERVLIHAAAGGVGLAAVQLAQRAGAEIFATAGTPEKRSYLESLGVQHVMDSRSLTFADEIMRVTEGQGVDVVLNSLPGEFAAKSLAVLGPFGRFVEIGKTDIYQNRPMGLLPFRNNLSYFAFDLERLCRERPDRIRALFVELMKLFEAGELQPLPRKVFPLSEISSAFRYMAGRKNLGKIVISFDSAARAGRQDSLLRSNATYLITGGLGSLGLTTALWMAGKGARNLVLLGRTDGSAYGRTVRKDLEAMGVRVLVVRADVSDPAALRRALAKIRDEMPPLRGIVHAAGVLEDRLIANLNPESLLRVTSPKAQGAWNLHVLTDGMPLDFFVLFSSLASVTGSPGQANYAAANAFLDALAHYRRSRNLPAVSINWGPWEAGMAARPERMRGMSARGISPLPAAQGLAALERILQSDLAEVAVVSAAWPEVARSFGEREAPALFSELLAQESRSGQTAHPNGGARREVLSHQVLLALDSAQQQALMLGHLRKSMARVMGLEETAIDPEETLNNLGIDSLMALEIQEALETSLQLKLPIDILMGMPSLNELSKRLLLLIAATEREGSRDPWQRAMAGTPRAGDPLR